MLWLLEVIRHHNYDEYDSHVVRASDEAVARKLCPYATARADTWLNEEYSTCKKLNPRGTPAVIISSFNAG